MTPSEFMQLVMDFKEVFGGPHGERVLKALVDIGFGDKVTYVPASVDPTGTAYNEGKRFMVLHIRRMMGANPNQEEEKHA